MRTKSDANMVLDKLQQQADILDSYIQILG